MCVYVCEGKRENSHMVNKYTDALGYHYRYLGNEAGHLVAIKLVWVFTVNINHSHFVSLTLGTVVGFLRKK